MSALAELFPDADFRHHLTLRRAVAGEFFAPSSANDEVLRERRQWIASAPHRYANLTDEGGPLVAEFLDLCTTWKFLPIRLHATRGSGHEPSDRATKLVEELGGELEPDFLLLSPDQNGGFRLHAGALCFPTGWALEEKLGHTLEFIHGVVPGLNSALGSPINQFLSKLKPGVAFERDNWGLSASAELNQHPVRALPAPATPVTLDRIWLRVEHQIVVALPETRGVVFGIRIANHRLDQMGGEGAAIRGLIRALRTMPDSMAKYKRFASIRAELIEQLRAAYVV